MKAKKEKSPRKLTEAEQKRLARFEETAAGLAAQGYARKDLIVSILWANVFAVILTVPLLVLGVLLFIRRSEGSVQMTVLQFLLLFVAYFALVVVHELVHGLTWACFSRHHWKDIEFGIMRDSLTPYCTCGAPLPKGSYILGALMPLILLGLLPTALALWQGWYGLMFLGILMISGAAGDILIVWKILTHRSACKEVICLDHPTQAGSVIFEK